MKPFCLLLIISFLIGAAFGQSDWGVVQGPQQPNIYSRSHAYFLNENEGWIYGTISSVSLILHTADAGATWTVQYNDSTSFKVYDLFFVNSNVGWLCGDDGTIWKSTNGGDNWIDKTPGLTTESLRGIQAANDSVVYTVGFSGTVLKTSDGGDSWSDQTIAGASGTRLYALYVFNADSVMAVDNSTGGEAVYTTDGGANWHTTILNYPPSSISSKTYYCSGTPGGIGYAVGYSGSVFKTKDYGQTWNNVAVLWPGMFKYLEAVAISDADHVWTGGYDYLYRTRDGGATWDTLYYPSASSLTYLKAFDNNTLYLFTTFGQLFKSSDAGDSWTPIFSWPNISLWDVVATSKRLYACADYEGEITTSDDGGLTWSYPVTPADGTYGNLFDLFFYDDNLGFFAGRDGLIGKTTDGGETWRIIPNSYGFSSNKSYNFIYFKDALNGIAGGTSGILQVSNDGGETWTESSIDTVNTPELLDCIFLGLSTGIISAKSGKVYRTTNGGSTWIEVTDKGSMSMKNVYFSDLQNGWIVASDGYIFKTTDGGETWSQTDQLSNINSGGANPDLYRISFVNPTTAYICGENGSIYQSTDTGASWTQLTAPAATIPWNLQGMVWLDESSGIIVGQDGYILGTRSSGLTTPTPLAQEFKLESNYPNPFNPATSISFTIPGTEKVKLVVYNTLGQKVRTLVSSVVAAGHHAVKWDGRNDFGLMSPSGVYFYKLDAGPYSQVRKMTLLK